MRILVVVHGFPPAAKGGAEIYAHAHARVLKEIFGDEIFVLTREQDPGRAEYTIRTEAHDGLQIAWVNNTFRNTRSFEDSYRNEAIGAIATRLIDDFRPDVAHVHHLTCLSTTIVGALAERGVPCFFTLHDYWLICHRGQLLDVHYRVCEGPEPDGCDVCLGSGGGVGTLGFIGAATARALERRLPAAPARQLRRVVSRLAPIAADAREAGEDARRRLAHMRHVCDDVTHFFAPSRCICERFVQFGVPRERITVAGYGYDHAPFNRLERIAASQLRLGFLGSLMVSKAPHVLLDAIGRLPRGAVCVDLFGAYSAYHGDDSYRQKLAPLVNQDGVRARGAIAHDQVPHALASIDVLVVPSIWPENSPLVIQEAFLAGVPVVASRIGGIPEVVQDGLNGLLFRAGDAADLARALTRLLDEPGLLDTLRTGIPPVRTIDEDVRQARAMYEARVLTRRHGRRRLAAIVLNHRTPDDTLLAVKSLLASRRPVDDVIVVNNDAADADRDALKDVWDDIIYIETGSNLGFSGGMNAGIRAALARGADRVLLVNSDAIVPPDGIEHLERCLDAAPDAGIAGPVILARSHPGEVQSLGMSYAPISGRMRHLGYCSRLAAAHDRPTAQRVDGVSGCLMLVRREVFDACGLFDEDYFFGFEDLDFCLKARRSGFATVLAGRATVYHEGGRSIGAGSPRRFYFAARNHLLMARRAEPSAGRLASFYRASSIVLLNVANAALSTGGSLPARLGAVARGTRDYVAGRYGGP
ncbi:MAG: hypothetical protein DMF91_00180 [Acidobacteria bacterium]|nr:MAG: hypothetical protein DMF91_00180 [Acidobacteriota bacterium]